MLAVALTKDRQTAYMPTLPVLVLYTCAYISLIAMVGVADSDACAQFSNILDPGEDLELERMIAFCTHISNNVSLPLSCPCGPEPEMSAGFPFADSM